MAKTPSNVDVDADATDGGLKNDQPRTEVDPNAAAASLPVAIKFTHQVIARDGLALRAGPGLDFPVIRQLALGTQVNIIKTEGQWALIDEAGDGAAEGYVFASFLEAIKKAASAAPAWSASASDDFVALDVPLLQIIMNRCAKVKMLRSPLDLTVVSDALNRSMQRAEATNRRREVGFLSQAIIETDYFRTFTEYGKGRGKPYYPYYGRGMHQLTWEPTYRSCSQALFNNDSLHKDPDMIIRDIEVNIEATAWFWRDYKTFNVWADAENVDEIIYHLYGGRITSPKPAVRNSVMLRRSYYSIIKIALNERRAGKI